MTSTSVFFSYARADDDANYDDPTKSFMRRLYNGLTAAGFDVWWDRASLPSRSLTFTVEIEQAIRACERFVLVVGPGAAQSDYVRAEYEFALAQCKPITPILRAGDYHLIPKALGIDNVNAIDCRPTRDEAAAVADIVARLRQPAPIGPAIGVKPLPRGYIVREQVYRRALDALQADAIQATVISAPPNNQSAVAVFGMGGVGKSTLAAALAHDCQIRRHYRDGVIWLEVGQDPNVAALQASVGVHFGDSRDNYPDERVGALSLSRVLQGKTALLVLDDVWDYKLADHFRLSGTACRLLITTRSGALATRVQGADIQLNTLTPEEGARLIANLTGGDPNDPDSRAIAEFLGGHTLAIVLAAAQIANAYADSPADMLRLLQKQQAAGDPFGDLQVEADDKDFNLSLSLSLSYKALPDDDLRRRFRALGVFALEGTFDRAALAAVWGDADEDKARAPLKKLVDAGLLDWDRQSGRYSQHRLLRAYARALLAQAGEDEAALKRHFEHYYSQHGDHDANNDEARHPGIAADWENVQAALAWGVNHAPEPACDLAWALDYYMKMRETLEIRREVFTQALTSAERAGYALGLANTLKALGDWSVRQDDLDAARGFFAQAMTLYQAIGDRVGQMNTLISLARMARDKENDLAAAKRHFEAVFAIADRTPAFRDHPVVQGWRREYAALSGDAPASQDQMAELVMELLKLLYAAGGADAVREMLKGKLPDEDIEAILAQLGGEA